MNNEYIEIGKIVNTFGIKGELKVQSKSDFLAYRFRVGAVIYLKMGQKILSVTISSMRILKGNVIITINDFKDINQVSSYVGSICLAKTNDVPPLNDDEYLIDDLVGLEVKTIDNEKYGKVKDVIIVPSNDILEIELLEGSIALVPFIKDYIEKVSKEEIIIKKYEVESC